MNFLHWFHRAVLVLLVIVLAWSAALFLSKPAQASTWSYTGNAMLKDLVDWKRAVDTEALPRPGAAIAFGYVSGFTSGLDEVVFCIKAGVNRRQIVDLVIGHLEANPADRHLSADILILGAMRPHFPCPPKTPSSSRGVNL